MKKILFVCLCMIGLYSCTQPLQTRDNFVRTFFAKYPESTLQDIYKGVSKMSLALPISLPTAKP